MSTSESQVILFLSAPSFSNTKPVFASEVHECLVLTAESLPWCGSVEYQPHSQIACQDELDTTLLFCSVVLSQGKWCQSQMQFLLPVFTSHSSTEVPLPVVRIGTCPSYGFSLALDFPWSLEPGKWYGAASGFWILASLSYNGIMSKHVGC